MKENRIAFIRLGTQDFPKASRFMALLRFIANIMIHLSACTAQAGHQAAFSPKSSEGSLPPAKSSFSGSSRPNLVGSGH